MNSPRCSCGLTRPTPRHRSSERLESLLLNLQEQRQAKARHYFAFQKPDAIVFKILARSIERKPMLAARTRPAFKDCHALSVRSFRMPGSLIVAIVASNVMPSSVWHIECRQPDRACRTCVPRATAKDFKLNAERLNNVAHAIGARRRRHAAIDRVPRPVI